MFGSSATDREDYVDIPKSDALSVSFPAGETTISVTIALVDDDVQEDYVPTFMVKLVQVSISRLVSFGTHEANVTIIDDDIKNVTVINRPGGVSEDCSDCVEESTFNATVSVLVITVFILAVVIVLLALVLLRYRHKVGITE